MAAALRETHEEIGVEARFIETWGTHPSFLTGTGFTMEPVIGLIRPGFEVKPDVTEVAEVFEVPLAFLMDPANHRLHRTTLPDGKQRLYFSMPWGPYFIWGQRLPWCVICTIILRRLTKCWPAAKDFGSVRQMRSQGNEEPVSGGVRGSGQVVSVLLVQ
ncbi:CoA pyrophosphatase [Neopusillimonas aromaticivorans]|nr:CoA pyrophosphatase [Neopusillimonas aromaticivorans]WJJ93376.1 CoA pyrophosphatase [Neopusillimonas aromaticivorans]